MVGGIYQKKIIFKSLFSLNESQNIQDFTLNIMPGESQTCLQIILQGGGKITLLQIILKIYKYMASRIIIALGKRTKKFVLQIAQKS